MGATPNYDLPYPEDADAPDGPAQIQALAEAVEAALSAQATVPAGVIAPFGGAAAPTGWLLCDGASVARADYSDLADALGIAPGATNFNLPNLRGRVPVGFDAAQDEFDTMGGTGGEKEHTLSIAELPKHKHGGGNHSHGGSTAPGGAHFHDFGTTQPWTSYPQVPGWVVGFVGSLNANALNSPYDAYELYRTADAPNHAHPINAEAPIADEGGDVAHENLPPYAVVNYIIKT